MAENEREPGVLSYPASPEMTGDNRFVELQQSEEKKTADDGRPLDAAGRPMLSYPSLQKGGDPSKCQLKYRDGRTIQLDYPSIKHALLVSPYINFEGSLLDGLNLTKIDISNRSFRGASFRGADLSGSKMANCDFSKAVLDDADCEGLSARGSKFLGAQMDEGTSLKNADLSYADLSNIEGFSRAEKEGIVIENVSGLELEEVENIVRDEESEEPD